MMTLSSEIINALKMFMIVFLSMLMGVFFIDSIKLVIDGIIPTNYLVYGAGLSMLLLDWVFKEFGVYGESEYPSQCEIG